MGKKISAIITAPRHKPYRAYFQESGDMILVWTKDTAAGLYRVDRFNNGVFSRDWGRELFAGSGAKVEF